MNNDLNLNNLNITAVGVIDTFSEEGDALEKRIGKKVRDARALLSPQQEIANRAQAERISERIDFDAEDKDSMFYEAVQTTRDAHKDAHGFRGNIYVSHTYCNTVDEYKQAYIEAWFELRLQATEAWEFQLAADKAVWSEHVKAIEACGYTGSKLEQLRKYCTQTIPAIANCPEDYFTEDGLSFCGGLEYSMRCSSQRKEINAWLNS